MALKMKRAKLKKAKKKSPVRSTPSLTSEIWPLERDIMVRPDRLRYVRKLIKSEECVFCKAARENPSFDSLVLYKSEIVMLVMNKFPYNNGHLMVMPVRHCGDLLALDSNEYQQLHSLIRTGVEVLKKTYDCSGFNIGMNLGATAGAGIPDHLHYHIVPRWAGDTNFFPVLADSKVISESLEQTYQNLVPYFRG